MRSRRAFGKVRRLPSGRYQASYVGLDSQRHYAPDTFEAPGAADRWLRTVRAQRCGPGELAELADILAAVSARLSALAGEA
jgi:hypothetical protein